MTGEASPYRRRVEAEADFHDARTRTDNGARMSYAYKSVNDVYDFGRVPAQCLDRSVLEVGCFTGDQASRLHAFTGRYRGVDISASAIDHCNARGLGPNYSFAVDDANRFDTIGDASIDYAFGQGVLHHLDLERFGPALARKLAPGGFARFVEPAQGNLLLRTFRRLTPRLRTADEHPFDQASMDVLARSFDVHVTYHALLRPYLPMLFLNHPAVTRASRWLDGHLLKVALLQRQAWLLQIELRDRRPAKA